MSYVTVCVIPLIAPRTPPLIMREPHLKMRPMIPSPGSAMRTTMDRTRKRTASFILENKTLLIGTPSLRLLLYIYFYVL